MVTVDLACTQAAWIDKDNPDTNYHGATKYRLAGTGSGPNRTYLLLSFEELPEEYWYRGVISASLVLTVNRNISGTAPFLNFDPQERAFDENTVTWNTNSNYLAFFAGLERPQSGSGDTTVTIPAYLTYYVVDGPEAALISVRAPSFRVHATESLSLSEYLDVYSKAAASDKRPILRINLSDENALVKPKVTAPAYSDRPNVAAGIEFSWSLVPVSSEGYKPIVQESATIYWNENGTEDPYNTIAVSGDVRSVTIPANTFPARDISSYIEPVVTGYRSVGSNWVFIHPRIYADMEPTGIAGVKSNYPDTNYPWTGQAYVQYYSSVGPSKPLYTNLLFAFAPFPSGYEHKAVEMAGLAVKSFIPRESKRGTQMFFLSGGFQANSVTWNNKPAAGQYYRGSLTYDNSESTQSFYPEVFIQATRKNDGESKTGDKAAISLIALECLDAPAFMLQSWGIERTQTESYTAYSGYFDVRNPVARRAMLIDQTVTSKPKAVTCADGYVNPHEAQTFAWTHVPDGDYWCVGGWETASATLYWSSDNGSTWNSVAAEAGRSEVVLPAETLPTGTIKWYVTATDDQGTTASSEVYTITTTDSATTATPIMPKDTIENGGAPIRFIWEVTNDYGTAPSGADLQKSNNGSSWTTLAQIQTSATQYDAPVGTFTTGTRYWRVRAYNADGVAGAWSDPVAFAVVGAPPAPVVSADGKPYATISWQSSGQMAYRVTVDGKLYGPYFGSAKSFEVPDFLTDGSHTAEVSVQGEAGLWSQPGSVTFSVTNIPGDPVSLTGKFGRDAALSWSTEATVANYYIYRDGIRIGHTNAKQFTDRYVLGAHEYFIVNKLPGGYYTRSNLSSGTMRSCTRAVAAFDGSGWLEMALSDESDTTEEFAWNQVVSERYVTGSDLPVVETSPYRSGSGSYRISFANVETGAAFEALRGRKIIVKSRGGNVAIGVLSGYTKTMGNFYINYVFSVRSCSWEDYVDETGD